MSKMKQYAENLAYQFLESQPEEEYSWEEVMEMIMKGEITNEDVVVPCRRIY